MREMANQLLHLQTRRRFGRLVTAPSRTSTGTPVPTSKAVAKITMSTIAAMGIKTRVARTTSRSLRSSGCGGVELVEVDVPGSSKRHTPDRPLHELKNDYRPCGQIGPDPEGPVTEEMGDDEDECREQGQHGSAKRLLFPSDRVARRRCAVRCARRSLPPFALAKRVRAV